MQYKKRSERSSHQINLSYKIELLTIKTLNAMSKITASFANEKVYVGLDVKKGV
jgi:hypothetical protein